MLDVLGAIHAARGRERRPLVGADGSQTAVARFVSFDDVTYTAQVQVYEQPEPITVPAAPSTYTGVTTVRVLLERGRPVYVLGPVSEASLEPLSAASTSESRYVVGAVVAPDGTGTWRADESSWAGLNDALDVYQGTSTSGAGPLRGLAWFGDQFTALGASSITRATLTLRSNGLGGAFTATVQGCASGTQPAGAPTFTGTTATVSITAGGVVYVDLDATTRENLRTGAVKSLGLNAAAFGGTVGAEPSWTVALDYEVTG